MKSKLLNMFLVSLLLVGFVLPISAEEAISLEEFEDLVESSEYYEMYEDSIVLQDVLVEADTEEGTRLTARYVLNEDEVEKYLLFVGDADGTLLDVLLTYSTDTLFSVTSLMNDETTNLNVRGPVYECVTVKCDKWETNYGFDPQPACSQIVGQPCNDLSVILGTPYATLICKLGVFIACSITSQKVCTHYYEEWDVCDL